MSSEATQADHRPDFLHREIMIIIAGLMSGMFLASLDQTIVAAAIRVIADDLGDLEGQAWATTAYLMTSTISTPLYGKISDIYGRKPLFTFAIAVFIFGSLLCTLATSMPMLAAFRAVQGIGAGGLFSLALAIIGDVVPPRERAKYQGYFLAVFGTSSVIGPVVGGFFAGYDSLLGVTGWRWVFLVNVPIGIAALFLVQRTLTLQHTRINHRVDYGGALALVLALVPLLLVAENGREWGWTSTSALICFGLGALGVALFLMAERAMKHEALMPLTIWKNRTIAVGAGGSVLLGMGMFGGVAVVPLYLQLVRGASPTSAGLQMLPMTLGIMIASIVSGQVIAKVGRYKMLPVLGTGLVTVALFGLHFMHYDTAFAWVMVGMFVFGFGLGFCMQPLVLAMQNAVPRAQIGMATATSTFMRQIGGTIGTALALSVLFSRVPGELATQMNKASTDADFAAALKNPAGDTEANQTYLRQLSDNTLGDSLLQDSSFLQVIDERLARPIWVAFANSMDTVFLLGSGIMALAFLVMWLLPNVELADDRKPTTPAE